MDLVEKAGSGIKKIRTALKEEGLPRPKFEFGGFFIVTFQRPRYEELREKLGGYRKNPPENDPS